MTIKELKEILRKRYGEHVDIDNIRIECKCWDLYGEEVELIAFPSMLKFDRDDDLSPIKTVLFDCCDNPKVV